MRKQRHTPGPWKISRRVRTAINSGQKHVAMVGFFKTGDPLTCIDETEHEGNVRLIAAAPELLAALEKAVDDCGKPGGPWNVSSEPGTWLAMAKEAIAKAKGESS